jgi:putative peptidoglycan lipid II flippase
MVPDQTSEQPIANAQYPISRKIIQATAVVTAIVLVVKALGFAEKILLAYFFGTGMQVDAYLVAYSIPFSAFVVLRAVVEPAFLPTFLRSLRLSERDGWRLFSAVGSSLLLFLGLATVVGVLLAAPLISLTAPGFAGQQRDLAVQLTRLAMPALLLLGLSTLTTAVLHARKRFALPALGEASYRAGPLLLLGFWVLGLSFASGVQALALGVIAGAVAKLGIETFGLRQGMRRIRLTLDLAFGPLQTVGRLAAPLLLALSLSLFVGPLVENAFASKVGVGGVAALAYARKIVETLTTILPYTLGLVLLPFSAEMAAGQNNRALANTLSAAVRALILVFLPVTVGLVVLREPFVRFLFERGAFTAESTRLTSGPLLFYALALLPFSLEVIVVQFYFARQDTLTPVIADIVAFALNVALIPLLMAPYGLGGIALAAAIAKAVKVLALLLLFERRVPAFRLASLGRFSGQMALAMLTTVAVLLTFRQLSGSLADSQGLAGLGAYLAGSGVSGGLAFVAAVYLLRVDEIHVLWRQARQWWQSRSLAPRP